MEYIGMIGIEMFVMFILVSFLTLVYKVAPYVEPVVMFRFVIVPIAWYTVAIVFLEAFGIDSISAISFVDHPWQILVYAAMLFVPGINTIRVSLTCATCALGSYVMYQIW